MSDLEVRDESRDETRVPAVEVSELTVVYGQDPALDSVSFVVRPQSTVAVIGASGSGKSTLLRAIAGLEPVDSGTVTIHGVDHTATPPHERRVGLMFQDHALFPHLDVAANVAFGMKMQRQSPERIAQRTAEVLELVGMTSFGRRRIETLSGGEAQRVALARALAPSPNILMLDEPLGSLDRALREELVSELRELFASLGLAVIHVTHDQQEAFSLADDVIVMGDGTIEQSGSPADVWRRPVSSSVASFLGHPNVWRTAGGAVLAPIPSLSIVERDAASSDDGSIEVEVIGTEFREGRYRVTAVARSATAGRARRFVVDCDVRPDFGAGLGRVIIDESQLVPLPF